MKKAPVKVSPVLNNRPGKVSVEICLHQISNPGRVASEGKGPGSKQWRPSSSSMANAVKNSPEIARKLVENLQSDLRTLSNECKRKYPPVKEVSYKKDSRTWHSPTISQWVAFSVKLARTVNCRHSYRHSFLICTMSGSMEELFLPPWWQSAMQWAIYL